VADASGTQRRPGLRELGLRIGDAPAGPANAITDVGGVAIGHVGVVRDEPAPPAGRGVARTGVTAIVPRPPETLLDAPVPAGAAVLNGAGEMTGFLQVSEWGVLETPVYLTATMAVGRIFDGAVSAAAAADPAAAERVVIPVVAECDDSWMCDPIPVQVEAEDARRALAAATGGPVAQGAVGAGTGMVCFGWKGGIGTSSRVVDALGVVVGVLVLANFGAWPDLRVDGVAVGRALGPPDTPLRRPAGSCIVVVATDAPLNTAQLERVARRAGLGLARTGSVAYHESGEIFLAFATTGPGGEGGPRVVEDQALDPIFAATVDATEEAVHNALWSADDVRGRAGRLVRALPRDDVLELLAAHGRLQRSAL
jgi:D-aminopeptidase